MSTPWIVAYVVLSSIVALIAVLVIGTLRRAIAVLDRLSGSSSIDFGGLPVLATVPPIELRDRGGSSIEFPSVIPETTLVLLMETSCGPCRTLSAALKRTEGRLNGVPIVGILEDSDEARVFPVPASIDVFYGDRAVVSSAFATSVTPYAFVVDVDGTVLERGIPNGLTDLKEMARHQKGRGSGRDRANLLTQTGGNR